MPVTGPASKSLWPGRSMPERSIASVPFARTGSPFAVRPVTAAATGESPNAGSANWPIWFTDSDLCRRRGGRRQRRRVIPADALAVIGEKRLHPLRRVGGDHEADVVLLVQPFDDF